MGAFESFLQKMAMSIGGGEEPKSKNVYTSQKDINKDNAWVRDFLLRKGAPMASQAVVARDIGDAKPKFVMQQGSVQPDRPKLQTTLPMGINIDHVFQNQNGQYGYQHPTEDYFVQVDPQAIYQKYGAKK